MNSEITIKAIQDLLIKGQKFQYVDDETSRRMWWAALEVVQKEFLSKYYHDGGMWVAVPCQLSTKKNFF